MARLDTYLFEKGYFSSRSKALQAIKADSVFVNGKVITKPSYKVADSDVIEVISEELNFVSRAGIKLYTAIKYYDMDISDLNALDIGASTGGFTDCMLQLGARKVYALDVGRGQLAPSLLADDRVVSMESVNARYIEKDLFEDEINLITVDVSFISLRYIIPTIARVLSEDGAVIVLIKPQFEVGKEKLPKNSVVKSEVDRIKAVQAVIEELKAYGFNCSDYIKSPIKGSKGNIEYLLMARINKEYKGDIYELS